jgi:hypothetical protein
MADEHYPYRPRVGLNFVGATLAPTPVSGLITVTPPAALTTMDSVLAASYKAVSWIVQGVKSTNTYFSQFMVAHDGTTPTWLEYGIVQAPAGDATVYDFTFSCAISGANLLIQVTPSSTGWTFYLRKTLMSA